MTNREKLAKFMGFPYTGSPKDFFPDPENNNGDAFDLLVKILDHCYDKELYAFLCANGDGNYNCGTAKLRNDREVDVAEGVGNDSQSAIRSAICELALKIVEDKSNG